ncbi:MAG: hypothetical protein IPP97_23470 [Candidatus Obscuribacter sp.]|nr:hypothetical protein [Candidatus Obscuribacter sp.]
MSQVSRQPRRLLAGWVALEKISAGLDYYQAVSELERSLLTRALEQSQGSRAEAARLLGINRQLLYAKLKTHGLMDE